LKLEQLKIPLKRILTPEFGLRELRGGTRGYEGLSRELGVQNLSKPKSRINKNSRTVCYNALNAVSQEIGT